MRKVLLVSFLAFLMAGLAYPMAQVEKVGDTAKPASSFIIGGHYDYRGLGVPGSTTTGMIGFVGPIARTASSGRLYGLAFGEAGKLSDGEQYKMETRAIYYFKTPGPGFNIGVICGAGITWNMYDPVMEIGAGETVAYLMGASGLVVSKPLSKLMGLWMAGEFQMGADVAEYRVGVGLNIYLGL